MITISLWKDDNGAQRFIVHEHADGEAIDVTDDWELRDCPCDDGRGDGLFLRQPVGELALAEKVAALDDNPPIVNIDMVSRAAPDEVAELLGSGKADDAVMDMLLRNRERLNELLTETPNDTALRQALTPTPLSDEEQVIADRQRMVDMEESEWREHILGINFDAIKDEEKRELRDVQRERNRDVSWNDA